MRGVHDAPILLLAMRRAAVAPSAMQRRALLVVVRVMVVVVASCAPRRLRHTATALMPVAARGAHTTTLTGAVAALRRFVQLFAQHFHFLRLFHLVFCSSAHN